MSEDTKKVEETEQKAKTTDLSEQELDKVAGGWSGSQGGDLIPTEGPR